MDTKSNEKKLLPPIKAGRKQRATLVVKKKRKDSFKSKNQAKKNAGVNEKSRRSSSSPPGRKTMAIKEVGSNTTSQTTEMVSERRVDPEAAGRQRRRKVGISKTKREEVPNNKKEENASNNEKEEDAFSQNGTCSEKNEKVAVNGSESDDFLTTDAKRCPEAEKKGSPFGRRAGFVSQSTNGGNILSKERREALCITTDKFTAGRIAARIVRKRF